MSAFERLARMFMSFPGIGARQARRFVYFLLNADGDFLDAFTAALREARTRMRRCGDCQRYFETNGAETPLLCDGCRNPHTDRGVLMIVEKDADVGVVERSGQYHGSYFVLHDIIPPAEPDKKIGVPVLSLLQQKIRRANEAGILKEIIIALSANPQGDLATMELVKTLGSIGKNGNFKISILGRGLSTGTELEYSDEDTLKHALENRK
ncbi:MAG: recombination protein RecR [Parcubacteria group bacterium]|nr:recombination protein RecR [Parcubacteria group bacterium]